MKKSTKIIGSVALASGFSLAAVGELLYGLVLTKPGTALVKKFSDLVDEDTMRVFVESTEAKGGAEWYKGVEKKSVYTYAKSGKKLNAVLIEAPEKSNVYVICCHGYTSKPAYMDVYAHHFNMMGYNVILPSLNGHSGSTDNKISMGWYDRFVVTAWVDYIVENNPDSPIILHGASMGGATVMMATGERMPENVKCCVEDCGYTSVWDVFRVQIRDSLHLPAFPILNVAQLSARLHGKLDFKKASALEQVKKSVTPTLFIHGDRDTFVPFWMLYPLYENAVCEKEKLVIEGAGHSVSAYIAPEIYWNKVTEFVSKYISE